MKISRIHQRFADRLQFQYSISKQEVLNHPEKYLGSNYKLVINFWLYLDTLSEDQLKDVEDCYNALRIKDIMDAKNNLMRYAWNPRYGFSAGISAFIISPYAKPVANWATLELIGLKKLLNQGHQPLFLPLIYPLMENKKFNFREIFKPILNFFGFNRDIDIIQKNPDYEDFKNDELEKLKVENALLKNQLSGKIYDV
jgi:hypothetical protein